MPVLMLRGARKSWPRGRPRREAPKTICSNHQPRVLIARIGPYSTGSKP